MAIKILLKGSNEFFTINKSTTFFNKGSKAVDGNASYFETGRAHKRGVYSEDIEQALIELAKVEAIKNETPGTFGGIKPGVSGGFKITGLDKHVVRNENGDFILSPEYYHKLRLCYSLDTSNSEETRASIEAITNLGDIVRSAKENSVDNEKALRDFNANVIKHFLQTDIKNTEVLQAKIKQEAGVLQQALEFNSPSWSQRAGNHIKDGLDRVVTAIVNFFKDVFNKLGLFKTSALEKRQAALELELQAKLPGIYEDKDIVGQLKSLMAEFDQSRNVGVPVMVSDVYSFIEKDSSRYKSLIDSVGLNNACVAITNAYLPKELDDKKARDQLARNNHKPNYSRAKDRTQGTKDEHRKNFDQNLAEYFTQRREKENPNQNHNSEDLDTEVRDRRLTPYLNAYINSAKGINKIGEVNTHSVESKVLSPEDKLINLLAFIDKNTMPANEVNGWKNGTYTYNAEYQGKTYKLPFDIVKAYRAHYYKGNEVNMDTLSKGILEDLKGSSSENIITKVIQQRGDNNYGVTNTYLEALGAVNGSNPDKRLVLEKVNKRNSNFDNVLQYGDINKPQVDMSQSNNEKLFDRNTRTIRNEATLNN